MTREKPTTVPTYYSEYSTNTYSTMTLQVLPLEPNNGTNHKILVLLILISLVLGPAHTKKGILASKKVPPKKVSKVRSA